MAAGETLLGMASSSLCVSVATLAVSVPSFFFFFHSQEVADSGGLLMGSSARGMKPQSNETSW